MKTNFDEDWKFNLGHASDPLKDFNYSLVSLFSKSGKGEGTAVDPHFVDSTWETIQLPHDWAVRLPFVYSSDPDVKAHGYKPVGGLFPASSIGWYRKHFSIPATDSGSRYLLKFDGIFRDARIWINGYYLGNNESGYVGVSYDITNYLNFHGENVIVVRADATQYEGWFYEGAGIYRHAWLCRYNDLHVAENGLFIYPEMEGYPGAKGFPEGKRQKAAFHIETTVENSGTKDSVCSVFTFITGREGKRVGEARDQVVHVAPGEQITLKQLIQVNDPKYWSPDNPYLYRVVSLIKSGNTLIDSVSQRSGLRSFRFDPELGFFLNGKKVKIKGVNCHQDHGGVGSAMPDFLQYYRVSLLKEMGANAYRTSHHAPSPELLDACDSLGLLVIDEQRLLNSSPEYAGQFERLIRRDRSRACVFLWCIGNEEGYAQTNSIGRRIALSLLAEQKRLDPTRTSTYAADLPNVYAGVNEVIPVRGFNYRQFAVEAYHKEHSGQPVIGTEMGSTVTTRGQYVTDTIRGYLPDQDSIAPWWASRAEEWWPLAAENSWWQGGFVWTGFDYRGEPTPFKWPNINSHFGMLDMCGFPKNIYYYYQSWWTGKDVLHISPHWNRTGKEGQPVVVKVNSNAASVELFLNGKTYGKKDMEKNRHLAWQIPYEPGVLEAVAYKDGRKINARVETTGKPYRLNIQVVKETLLADGADGTLLNIDVLDSSGREVPDADNEIHFSLSGSASILGVANGDPSSHEPDICHEGEWRRKLFNGKCQLILRAGKQPGIIVIKAESVNLEPGSGILQSYPVSSGRQAGYSDN
ncbi:beta-galactosidase GalA [Flavitalea flava]